MPPLVLIHGAFTGGWIWRRAVRRLAALGHESFAPTLTGCGDRSHLLRPETSLAMHVEDVAQLLFHEDLERAVLAGHGYGGMIASAVAHRHGGKVAGVIHLDSLVPERGATFLDTLGRQAVRAGSDWLVPPPPAESFGITCKEMVRWLSVRLQPFPRACLETPYPYGRRDRSLPSVYIRTSGHAGDGAIRAQAARAALSKARVAELPTGPLPMVTNPGKLAKVLAEAVKGMDMAPLGMQGGGKDRRIKRCTRGNADG